MNDTNKELIPPQTQIGDYRVVGHFASGGMGDVYEVVNPLLREFFAMKVLREDDITSSRSEAIQNFLAEARTTIRLRHNNIVTLHTMGLEPLKGRLYFIMDYIGLSPTRRNDVLNGTAWFIAESTGGGGGAISRTPLSLEDVLKRQGRIKENIVRILAVDIARALQYAHTFPEGSVVHCDLKPSNILLREDGHAVIADFGIAQAQRGTEPNEAASTSIRGTPDYMAPEQWDLNNEITPAVDIYAYGVMICRLLTGTLPVGIWKRPSELGMNPGWDVLIERCIRKDPKERWKSMRDIIIWLRNLPNYAQQVKRQQAMRRTFTILGSISAALLFIGIVTFAIHNRNASHTDERPVHTWKKAVVDPDAFVNRDLTNPIPHFSKTGPLVYPPSANPKLRTPGETLSGVNVLVIPKQITEFEAGFFDRFPRLEYIVCDRENATFFSQDGILYRKGKPLVAVAIPSKLYGTITLPEGISQIEVPWRNATISEKQLVTRGAYNQPLTLISNNPISWILPE